MRNLNVVLFCVAGMTAAAPSLLRAQAPAAPAPAPAATTAPATQPAAPAGPSVFQLTLHPSPATQPAPRYKLLPDLADQTPGNAVPLYLLARRSWPDQKTTSEVLYPENERYDYLGTPTDQFPKAYAERIFATYADTLKYVDLGARRREAEWDLGWRELGLENQRTLSYLNDLRHAANLVSFRARVQVLGQDWPAAAYSLQTGFAMARHLGTEPTLIHALVQVGFTEIALHNGVTEWIGHGDSPNLYWALTDLPRPVTELRAIPQWEQEVLPYWKPLLAQALRGDLPPAQWPAFIRETVGTLQEYRPPYKRDPAQVEAEAARLTQSALPRAKQFLLAAGVPKEKVEAMSADEAVGTYLSREYRAASEELWKAWSLPYWQAEEQMLRAWRALAPDRPPAVENPLIQTHLATFVGSDGKVNYEIPSVLRMRYQIARSERHLDLLLTVEALRDYAARHDGRPPERLEQVRDLPVPTDPVTGEAFVYRLGGDGRTAVLEAPAPHGMSVRGTWRFELTFAP